MSRLKISLRGAVLNEIGLSPEREYIGGRKESCDIRLQAEKGISREHFSLKFEDGKWRLRSLSRFGEIYSLGQRIEDISLEHNQNFQIPPYEFNFSEIEQSVSPEAGTQDPVEFSENEKTVIGAVQQMPYVKMISAQGDVREMLRLEFGDIWVAGRDSSCQIVIPDQRVSRRQFEIRKINNTFTIIDLDSVNGTFLNGSPVSSTDPQPLKSGDAISVLDNTMYFELHDPNFQYRMDRIEIPPLQLVPEVEEFESEVPMSDESLSNFAPIDGEISQEGHYVPQQLEVSDSPFTGMNNQSAPDQNQYYTIQPPPAEVKVSLFKRVTSNKPLFIALCLLILGGSYFLSEYLKPSDETTKPTVAAATDPFSKLSPDMQKKVQDWYDTSEKTLQSDTPKLSTARELLQRIEQVLPDGYKNSKDLMNQVLVLEAQLSEAETAERERRDKEENDAIVNKNLEECAKLLGPSVTLDQMSNCLTPAKTYNPNHTELLALEDKARKIEVERQAQDEAKLNYQSQVKSLEEIYEQAIEIHKKAYPYKAISAYEKVLKSDLPDPNGLKKQAQAHINYINKTIKNKVSTSLADAENYKKEGKIKLSIKALRDVLVFNPENKEIKTKIANYESELKTQLMSIYQDSVIDESFGYVDGNETRPGAKEKWKQIIATDLEDGEYYRKANAKLRKYGIIL